jgi:hypothetical protein
MKFFHWGRPAAGEDMEKDATVSAGKFVRRRIEITVEQETVTLLMRGRPEMNEMEPSGASGALQSGRLELSPPAPSTPEMDCE